VCALYHNQEKGGNNNLCERYEELGWSGVKKVYVGVCRLTLEIPESHSLKEKRRRVRSIIDRLRIRHRLSVAETGFQDTWQTAEIGISAVSGDSTLARKLIEAAIEYVETEALDVSIIEEDTDVIDLS